MQPGPWVGMEGAEKRGGFYWEGRHAGKHQGGWQLTVLEPPPRPRPGGPVVSKPSLVADGDAAGGKRLGAGQPQAAGGCFPLTLSRMNWLPGLASQSCFNGKRPVSPVEHCGEEATGQSMASATAGFLGHMSASCGPQARPTDVPRSRPNLPGPLYPRTQHLD